MIKLSPTEIFFYGTAWAAFWGIVVWFAKDWAYDKRTRLDRRRVFIAFMTVWRTEVADCKTGPAQEQLWVDKKKEFLHAASLIKDDFKDGIRFAQLCDQVWSAGCKAAEVKDTQDGRTELLGRTTLLTAIEAAVIFVELGGRIAAENGNE